MNLKFNKFYDQNIINIKLLNINTMNFKYSMLIGILGIVFWLIGILIGDLISSFTFIRDSTMNIVGGGVGLLFGVLLGLNIANRKEKYV